MEILSIETINDGTTVTTYADGSINYCNKRNCTNYTVSPDGAKTYNDCGNIAVIKDGKLLKYVPNETVWAPIYLTYKELTDLGDGLPETVYKREITLQDSAVKTLNGYPKHQTCDGEGGCSANCSYCKKLVDISGLSPDVEGIWLQCSSKVKVFTKEVKTTLTFHIWEKQTKLRERIKNWPYYEVVYEDCTAIKVKQKVSK